MLRFPAFLDYIMYQVLEFLHSLNNFLVGSKARKYFNWFVIFSTSACLMFVTIHIFTGADFHIKVCQTDSNVAVNFNEENRCHYLISGSPHLSSPHFLDS